MWIEKWIPWIPWWRLVVWFGQRYVCRMCFEDFEVRQQHPKLQCCENCAPDNDIPEHICPTCGWDSLNYSWPDPESSEPCACVTSGRYADYEYGYLGGEHWNENWTCPECGTAFDYSNSSV